MSLIVDKFDAGEVELFAGEGQPAVELLQSNPLAGFCLALNHIFHKPVDRFPLAVAREQMVKPQREILGFCGFRPATEAVAKVGRKCVPESLSLERCLHLRRVLVEDETRKLLGHLPRINAGVIELVASRVFRQSITPQLLHSVAVSDEEVTEAQTAQLLRDSFKMAAILRRRDPPRRFLSRQRITEDHDELVEEMNRCGVDRFRRRCFPRPPIAGIRRPGEEILPVIDSDALQALGREQHNCVSSYSDQILSGTTAVYRVTVQGEVCTLSLVKDGQGSWRISEFKAVCNSQPTPLARYAVRRWFDSSRIVSLNFPPPRRFTNRALPKPPFSGAALPGLQISPVPNTKALAECLGNTIEADFYHQRARDGREFFYQAITECGTHLVSIERHRNAYRLKAIRGAVSGDVLVALSNWLGHAQGRYR